MKATDMSVAFFYLYRGLSWKEHNLYLELV